ncbi:chromatin assembly factor 1 subunit FAS2-like isoform X2 [Selaginella moellendorffii]|uniref:chromatin assembly factor 1 subunit FAS2-like isoform X2 n=1 Tax=Selaginella moellendorffii TaxID=88036 RepID=UPI000D1CA7F2|nr:chromatin assembly factor 1 subunit FAS2-like isoform X2 [Selaginella moellendorffii]|eukprot:XP_024524120.1 chromatin assembly factor 1 subunit FAS2-like isoform X2 [Selaginella moellendorffii]
MKAGTVQIAWHGCDPVLSADFHPVSGLLATCGADKDIKLWLLASVDGKALTKVTFEASLSHHSAAVNAVRFSPSGDALASGAGEGELALWRLTENKDGATVWKVVKALRSHLNDVHDLGWSADGLMLASGSVDNSCVVWDMTKYEPLQVIKDHAHYVQGVAWDPIGYYLVSMSSDRTCRIYSRSQTPGTKAFTCQRVISKAEFPTGDSSGDDIKKCHLFADESMPSFFRRLAWSPDGSFLLVPAGLHKGSVNAAFAFSRRDLSRPALHFPGASKAVVATSFCPVKFALEGNTENRVFNLPHRLVFAIATLNSVAIYNTQMLNPTAFLGGIHYRAITDLAWSHDAKFLVVSSQDGYCTVVEFEEGELGRAVTGKAVGEGALSQGQEPFIT